MKYVNINYKIYKIINLQDIYIYIIYIIYYILYYITYIIYYVYVYIYIGEHKVVGSIPTQTK